MRLSRLRLICGVWAGLTILVGSTHVLAQAPRWNAPGAVFLHDSVNKTIRPLIGMAGSSYPGAPLLDGVEWASFAPTNKSALVSREGVLEWIPELTASNPPSRTLSYKIVGVPVPQQAIWSSDSLRATALGADSKRLFWLGQFDSLPSIQASWDLDVSQSAWTLLAADSSANLVLLASQQGDVGRLWIASPTKPPVMIFGFSRPVAAAIAIGATTAFVADAAIHQILQVSGLSSNPVVAPVVIPEGYVGDPVGIALSKDGSRLFVADGKGKMIRVFQTNTGVLNVELPLQLAPRSMTALTASSFVVGGRQSKDQPFYLLDTRAEGRLYFVPAGQ